ncbi:MAG: hypothetical protein WCS89_00265 [Candidatus Paceibacterota bacterium]
MSKSFNSQILMARMLADEDGGLFGDYSQKHTLGNETEIPVKKEDDPKTCPRCGLVFSRGCDTAHACVAD